MLFADPVNIQEYARGFEYGVIHCRCEKPEDLISFIETHIKDFSYTPQELLELGSVYVNHHRALTNRGLIPADYVRIHRKPRRFGVKDILWKERVIFENELFLILNKPAEVPCHPTVDNIQENVLKSLTKSMNREFYITHRLDTPTEGLLILSKDKESQKRINQAFAERNVKKIYRAWSTNKNLAPGFYEHHMIKSPRAPKLLSESAQENTESCQLIVNEVELFKDHAEYSIELVTGRTHQIRAQMSQLGAPLLGDKMYSGPEWENKEGIALWCSELIIAESVFGQKFHFKLPFPKHKNEPGSHHF